MNALLESFDQCIYFAKGCNKPSFYIALLLLVKKVHSDICLSPVVIVGTVFTTVMKVIFLMKYLTKSTDYALLCIPFYTKSTIY